MTHLGAAAGPSATRLPAAAVMLVLSFCGMAIGLAIDCSATPPDLLAALCAASSGSLAATLSFHIAVMPASYMVMGAAAILAVAFNRAMPARGTGPRTASRFAAGAASVALMLAGMFAGGWLAPEAAVRLGREPGFVALVGGMAAGMALAALIAAVIAAAVDAAIARRAGGQPQYIMYQ